MSTLLQVTEKLRRSLQNTKAAEAATKGQLATLQKRFDDAMKASLNKERGDAGGEGQVSAAV